MKRLINKTFLTITGLLILIIPLAFISLIIIALVKYICG